VQKAWLALLVWWLPATLGGAPGARRTVAAPQDTTVAQRIAAELEPKVEAATGMRFRYPPQIAERTRDQLRAYVDHKLTEDFPAAQMRGLERTYHLFGVVDDTTNVRQLLLDLYAEQVAGFYDTDSTKLFVIRGGDPQLLRAVMAHELVHALQDQHTRLNAVLRMHGDNDRQSAGQAVFEGQAMVGMLRALQPSVTDDQLNTMIDAMRRSTQSPVASMPVLSRAPRFITDGLIFPYADGAAFILAFEARRTSDTAQPFGAALPISTEQILHPAAYATHDVPARVRFAPHARADTLVYEDDLGEFETRETLMAWGEADDVAGAAAAGWDGDRYEILGTPSGTVLVWAAAWDTEADAADFAHRVREGWTRRAARMTDAATRRFTVDRLTIGGVSVVRLVDAPRRWSEWSRLPAVRLGR